MPSTYSTRLRFELIGTGEQSGTWGATTNTNLGTLIEEAIAGVATVTVSAAADTTLTTSNGGTDQARNMVINLTGTMTQQNNIICPAVQKIYFVKNGTSGGFSVVFKTASGTGVTITNGRTRAVYCDGTNVVDLFNDLATGTRVGGIDIVTLSDTQTLTSKTLTSPRVGTAVLDVNGNEIISLSATASAVNEVQIINAATGVAPTVATIGNDTNIGIALLPKGTGNVEVNNSLRLKGATSGYVGLGVPATAGSTTYTLPSADGTNGQALTTNGSGTLSWTVPQSIVRNAQIGTTYTVLTGDRGKWVTFSNASAVAVTLPQANGTTFGGGWYFYAENIGAGLVTITPTTSTINGAATIVLSKGQWALIESDDTNYRALFGGAPGRQTIWVPASAMIARTDTAGGGPSLATFTATTNKTTLPGLAFDPSTVEYAQFSVRMPKGWDEGTVSYVAAWSHASTATNFGVAWSLQGVAISDLDALDVAMGTAQQVNDTGGTTDTLYVTAEPGTAVTIAGTPQPQDLVVFQISRVATDATNDTMTIDARLHGVTIYYTTDVADDR